MSLARKGETAKSDAKRVMVKSPLLWGSQKGRAERSIAGKREHEAVNPSRDGKKKGNGYFFSLSRQRGK